MQSFRKQALYLDTNPTLTPSFIPCATVASSRRYRLLRMRRLPIQRLPMAAPSVTNKLHPSQRGNTSIPLQEGPSTYRATSYGIAATSCRFLLLLLCLYCQPDTTSRRQVRDCAGAGSPHSVLAHLLYSAPSYVFRTLCRYVGSLKHEDKFRCFQLTSFRQVCTSINRLLDSPA